MHSIRAFHLSFALLALAACSDDGPSGPRPLAGSCDSNTDCQPGLVCEFQQCHQPCTVEAECPGDQRCVLGLVIDDAGTTQRVCQLEENNMCTTAPQCVGKQVCAGNECRDECRTDNNCTSGQACVGGRCYSRDPAKDTLPDAGVDAGATADAAGIDAAR